LTRLEALSKMILRGEMMQKIPEKLIERQYISIDEFHNAGYSNYKIRRLVDEGVISCVNRRWYENIMYSGEINDFYAVGAIAEHGVVCLMSAAVYYDMSTERPSGIDVALPRSARVPASPDWPAMRFYRMGDMRYSTGIEEVREGENTFFIYDREKTVCDIILYRNKLGFEPAMEVLKMYVNSEGRDISRLLKYAESLHVKSTINPYLKVLL